MAHDFLQDLDGKVFEPWVPNEYEKRAKQEDEEMINDCLKRRSEEEEGWRWIASRWNLLKEPNDDPRLSNILLPFVRMIGATAIASLSQSARTNKYKPRQRSDDAKAILWQSASDHVDNMTGMQFELDDFYTNFTLFGTAGLEDYAHLPHTTDRIKVDGKWTYKVRRDFSVPRIGTRSRSPWSFGFWLGSTNANENTPIFMRDFYSFNNFTNSFSNVRLSDGSYQYMNCAHVQPGQQAIMSKDDSVLYEPMDHNGVSVITVQDPARDIMRRYANGVLIQDISLREYNRIKKTTLSIAQNNHKFDLNLRERSPYAFGDIHLIRGLDSLYQAIGNLNIDNYKLANTNLISVRGQNGATALDEDIEYLSGVRIDGDVLVSPMGSVRLGDFSAFKEMIDQWAKWTTKVPFDQLLAENRSGTAFELQQQIRDAMKGTQYKVERLAAGCFKKHAMNRLSFILSDMTVEEMMDLDAAEIPEVMELIKNNAAPKDDYKYKDGKPVQRIMRERVKVKNRDIVEKYTSGKRSINDLQDKGPSENDSEVTVTKEYFWPVEFAESGSIPDIDVEVDLGAEEELRFQKMQFIGNYARQRIAESAGNPQVEELQTDFDARKIDSELVASVGLPKDRLMRSTREDQDIEKLDSLISSLQPSPPQNAQSIQVQNVDAQGLGAFSGQPTPAQNPVAAAERGVFGAA